MSFTATKIFAGCFLMIGALTVASIGLPVLANDGTEGDGQRRSPEAETGQRRSAEAVAGPRRSAESEGGPRRSAKGQGSRESGNPLTGFKPQTQREAALYQMIVQLQREVAELRQAVGQPSGNVRGEGSESIGQQNGKAPALVAGWERSKVGGVFRTYDKNRDMFVSLDEWLAMTNGNISAARRQLQTQRFRETGPGSDGKLSPAEFVHWWNNREGAQRSSRGGEPETGRSAEREAGPRRSAEGEGQRRSPEAEGGPRRSSENERDN